MEFKTGEVYKSDYNGGLIKIINVADGLCTYITLDGSKESFPRFSKTSLFAERLTLVKGYGSPLWKVLNE